MARSSTEVDMIRLKNVFLQMDGKFDNRGDLWVAISHYYNQNLPTSLKEISFSIAKSRIESAEWNIKTPKGKRGRSDVYLSRNGTKRTSRKDKFQNNPVIKDSLKLMLASTPQRGETVALKIIDGSANAAIKLKCLECSNYQTLEVKHCQIPSCSLYAFRPYQGKNDIQENEQEQREAA